MHMIVVRNQQMLNCRKGTPGEKVSFFFQPEYLTNAMYDLNQDFFDVYQ